jgi:hypothetical protein
VSGGKKVSERERERKRGREADERLTQRNVV